MDTRAGRHHKEGSRAGTQVFEGVKGATDVQGAEYVLGEGEKKGQEGRLELYACDGYSRKRPQDTGTRSIKEALIHVGPSGT
jgi:hypothetical protein